MQPLSDIYKEKLYSEYINDIVDTLGKNGIHIIFPYCCPNILLQFNYYSIQI